MPATALNRIASLVLALCIAIVLIASPLHLLFRPEYARYQYASEGFPASSRFDPEERASLSDTILRYMQGRVTLEEMATMQTRDRSAALRASEAQHLADVRAVIQAFFTVQAVAIAVGALASVALARADLAGLVMGLRMGVGLIFGLLLIVGVAAAIDFDLFFTLFHGVFFDAGTWTFVYEDTLIQLYPLPFWINAVTHVLILIAALGVIFLAAARLLSLYLRRGVRS